MRLVEVASNGSSPNGWNPRTQDLHLFQMPHMRAFFLGRWGRCHDASRPSSAAGLDNMGRPLRCHRTTTQPVAIRTPLVAYPFAHQAQRAVFNLAIGVAMHCEEHPLMCTASASCNPANWSWLTARMRCGSTTFQSTRNVAPCFALFEFVQVGSQIVVRHGAAVGEHHLHHAITLPSTVVVSAQPGHHLHQQPGGISVQRIRLLLKDLWLTDGMACAPAH